MGIEQEQLKKAELLYSRVELQRDLALDLQNLSLLT